MDEHWGNEMTTRELKEHWKVQVIFDGYEESDPGGELGCVIKLASWTEPLVLYRPCTCAAVICLCGRNVVQDVKADWINNSAYGEILGFINWEDAAAITWKHYVPPDPQSSNTESAS